MRKRGGFPFLFSSAFLCASAFTSSSDFGKARAREILERPSKLRVEADSSRGEPQYRFLWDGKDSEEWIRILETGTRSERQEAAGALSHVGFWDLRTLRALGGALKDEDADVRRLAVWSLAEFEPPDLAVPLIAVALRDSNLYVRRAAVGRLEMLGEAASTAALDLVYWLQDAGFVRATVDALGAMGPAAAKAVPQLLRILREGDTQQANTVAKALARIDPSITEPIATLVDAYEDGKCYVWVTESLIRYRGAAVPVLVRALESAGPKLRCCLLHTLRRFGPLASGAVPAAIRHLDDEDENVRESAAILLSAIGPAAAEAVPELVETLRSSTGELPGHATSALGSVGPAAVSALVELLKDPEPALRSRAARALSLMKRAAGPAAEALKRARSDADLGVRLHAAIALSRLGVDIEKPGDLVVEGIRSADPEIRRAAGELATACGERIADAIPGLVDHYGDSRAARAINAAGSGAIGALPAAIRQLEKEHEETLYQALSTIRALGKEAATAAPALVGVMERSPTRRSQIAGILGEMGPVAKPALPRLIEMLDDDEALADIALAIHRIDPGVKAAIPRLRSHLGRGPGREEMPSPGGPTVLRHQRRVQAARALWEIRARPGEVVPVLLEEIRTHLSGGISFPAMEVLTGIGAPARAALPWLYRELRNRSDDLDSPGDEANYGNRRGAARAIWTIAGDARPLLAILSERMAAIPFGPFRGEEIAAFARDLGARAVPSFAGYLEDENPLVRREAARALRLIGAPAGETIPKLKKHLDDSDYRVREAARDAIRSIRG